MTSLPSPGAEEELVVERVRDVPLPARATEGSAGYDLVAADNCPVVPNWGTLVPAGIRIKMPAGCYGRVAPRSGLAKDFHIDVGAGVIDADYQGEIHVLLFNHGSQSVYIKKHQRIAQLIIERIATPPVREGVVGDAPTTRGAAGFGSTGS